MLSLFDLWDRASLSVCDSQQLVSTGCPSRRLRQLTTVSTTTLWSAEGRGEVRAHAGLHFSLFASLVGPTLNGGSQCAPLTERRLIVRSNEFVSAPLSFYPLFNAWILRCHADKATAPIKS